MRIDIGLTCFKGMLEHEHALSVVERREEH